MSLRKILENPDGGQLLTGYMVLAFLILLAVLVAGSVVVKLLLGERVEVNGDGFGLIAVLAFGIPAALKFVKSRHVRDQGGDQSKGNLS